MKTTFPPATWGRRPEQSPQWRKLPRIRSHKAATRLVAQGWELVFLNHNETP